MLDTSIQRASTTDIDEDVLPVGSGCSEVPERNKLSIPKCLQDAWVRGTISSYSGFS